MLISSSLVVLILTGCKTNVPAATDEQLINIFSKVPFMTFVLPKDDEPKQIYKEVTECVELLSGMNKEIYVDMPKDMLGVFKTECRKMMQGLFDNTEKNTVGLRLTDLENTKFAERILNLSEKQSAALKEFRSKQ